MRIRDRQLASPPSASAAAAAAPVVAATTGAAAAAAAAAAVLPPPYPTADPASPPVLLFGETPPPPGRAALSLGGAAPVLAGPLPQRPPNATSAYRGVTLHKRTQRWEAHLWEDKKQVYLGGFDSERDAAKAHDVAAIKMRGARAELNFAASNYVEIAPILDTMDKDAVVHMLRGAARKRVADSKPTRAPSVAGSVSKAKKKRPPPSPAKASPVSRAAAATPTGAAPPAPGAFATPARVPEVAPQPPPVVAGDGGPLRRAVRRGPTAAAPTPPPSGPAATPAALVAGEASLSQRLMADVGVGWAVELGTTPARRGALRVGATPTAGLLAAPATLSAARGGGDGVGGGAYPTPLPLDLEALMASPGDV